MFYNTDYITSILMCIKTPNCILNYCVFRTEDECITFETSFQLKQNYRSGK